METACLLYQITRKKEYLKEAQQMAEAAFAKWFDNYYYPQLRREIKVAKGNTWFNAILLRGYLALYRIDGNNQYIKAYEDMFNNVWMAPEGMDQTGLLNYNDFKGLKPQKSWEVIHIGACVEMMARLALNRLE